MENFSYTIKENGTVVEVEITGYFDGKAGATVKEAIWEFLRKKKNLLLIDFLNCKIINSPGLAALMNITLGITDDFRGKLVLTGLDELKQNVLEMAGVIPLAETAPAKGDGLKLFEKS
ncbi:MAG: STAS domain-containing protein [Candidatus Riflebacteria bacterium]|nr:STAS domain-containing protein [Candidatus Riflebacteria bacterium]